MSRCCMCDYCPTTPGGVHEIRNLTYDPSSDEHYCDKCIREWNIALAEYAEIIPPPKEDPDVK